MSSPERLARIVAELIEDLSADGVIYAEVRLRPPTEDDGLWHAMMESAIQTARAVAAPAVEFIAVMLRGWSEERAVREARRAAVWAGRGIVALDIAGDEAIGGFGRWRRRWAWRARPASRSIPTRASRAARPPCARR